MLSTQEARRPRFRSIPQDVTRFVLRQLIKLAVLGAILIWRFKPVVAVIVVVVGISFWWASSMQDPYLPASGGTAISQRISEAVASVPPSPAAEQYLWGQSRYDANAMWSSLSEDMKQATARSGGMTLQRLEQQLAQAQQGGLRYDSVRYVGGHRAPDGRSFYLYVVSVSSGANTRYVPYTFTISNEGKIVNID